MIKFSTKLFTSFVLAFALTAFLFISPIHAQTTESINDYVTDITINEDSSINVVETISYNFGDAQRHGILRNIPFKYKARGGTFKLRIDDVSVTDDKGSLINFVQSSSRGDVVLKIGDADIFVTGQKIYKIAYTVRRAVNYFDDHDELYWNAVGTGWQVPITKAQAIVRAPSDINQVLCYTGIVGSDEKNCSIAGGNTSTVTFTTTKPLAENEGLTIIAGLPANTLTKPTTLQKFWDTLIDNGILVLPVLIFIIMFYLWNRFGKDAKQKNSIVAQYDAPDNLSALYVGSLLHNGTTNKDISAEIIYLATQGFISIRKIETKKMLVFRGQDYEFTRLSKQADRLPNQTTALLESLFSSNQTVVKLSDLKIDTSFGKGLVKIKAGTMKELVQNGYYKANPVLVKTLWIGLGGLGTVLSAIFLGNLMGYLAVLSVGISGVIVIVFGLIMPARTQKGADAFAHIKGLKEYLTVAEKDRLNFHNAPPQTPQQSPQLFELLLPFAIALGVEVAWANQFKDLTKAPDWYTDNSGSAFNSAMFVSSLNHFSDSMQSVARSVTTSSSGGSGFSGGGSGGGGGGGGGGSW